MKTTAGFTVLSLVAALSPLFAVDVVDGSALTVPEGETCVVSGTHTIPAFSSKGTITLAEGADVTVSGTQTASSCIANGVNGTLNLEANAKLVIRSYDKSLSQQGLVGGYMGGTGTVNVAAGALLSVPDSGTRFRLSSNSGADRTPATYGILNVDGTVDVNYLEMAAFWPNTITDTNLFTRASEVNVRPGGVFRAAGIFANDASIVRINMLGGTWKMKEANTTYLATGYGAIVELDFAEGTTSTFESNGDVTFKADSNISLSGSGSLVKTGPGILALYRPEGYGSNNFTGNIRVEAGTVYLGRALVEGQTVYVCKGASYLKAVPADATHITYEDPSEAPAAGGLYTVNAEHPDGIDLLALTDFDSDRLGGPTRNISVSVGGAVTHAAATREHPFTLVGQYWSATLNLLNTDIDQTPIRLQGNGTFRFTGDRVLTPADAEDIQFAGGTYGKTGTVTFKTGADTYTIDNGSISADNIYVGSDGVNGTVVLANGNLTAADRFGVGSNPVGDDRFHTTGTLTLTNATVTAGDFRFGANGFTDGSTVGELYGTVNLEAGSRLKANVTCNDEGRSQIVFKGGVLQPSSKGGNVVTVNQTGTVDLIADAGNSIVVDTVASTNTLANASVGPQQVKFTGAGGFVKRGSGLLSLGYANRFVMDYAGNTVLEDGTVELSCDNPFPAGAGKGILEVRMAKALDLKGRTLTVNNVNSVDGGITNTAVTAAKLDVGADNQNALTRLTLPSNVILEKVGTGTNEFVAGLPPRFNVLGGTARITPATFAHYRFKVEKVYGSTANSMQIGELKLLDGESDVTRPYASVSRSGTGKASPANEQPVKAVDGVLTTKFLDFNGANDSTGSDALRDSCWLQLDYEAPVHVTGYAWATGNDCYTITDTRCRSPQNWRLQGSSDGVNWVDLDARTGYEVQNAVASSWVQSEPFTVYEASSAVATVNVAAESTLEIVGEHAFAALTSEGTTRLTEGAVASFPSGGMVSGAIVGPGRIEKTGTGALLVNAGPDLTADVVVKGGTLCFGKGLADKWFRLTIRKTYSSGDTAMQVSEFKLLDAAGERVNQGLTMVTVGTVASSLVAGTFCKAANYSAGKATEDADKMFDGDTATKWCATGVGGLKTGAESDWRTITLRLADDAGVVASYNFTTANDVAGRSPSSWLLEASPDGVTWRTVDDQSDVPLTSAYFTDFNGGTPYALVAASTTASRMEGIVEVRPGATADIINESAQLAAIRIDGTAGAGTFNHVDFAANGVLHLVNATVAGTVSELPVTLGEVRNVANLKSWKVTVDGVVKNNLKVGVANGKLIVYAAGMVIYFR